MNLTKKKTIKIAFHKTMSTPLEVIPEHLREYISEQNPSFYSSIDQAVWRYVMRVSKAFFAAYGHPLYEQGIETTGMSTEEIPNVSDMDRALRKIGWRAVPINGFIPPSIFLEFQSLKILAIACDIRKLENLGYTPSPDIIHEAAGHAPIVADPTYRAYLEAYGEVARNALISKYDLELYDAILKLSELKEDPNAHPLDINAAQKNFESIAAKKTEPSEAALLTRMAWWTTEYGLIEKDDKILIYGAGLLSSVSESFNCLKDKVKKIPFSLEATINTSYDITRPQPQLFVTKGFEELTAALETFAGTMAYRQGGAYGLKAAKTAGTTSTVVFDNGIQISGIIENIQVLDNDEESAFSVLGQKQISFRDQACEDFISSHLPTELFIPLFDRNLISTDINDLKRKIHGSGLHTKSGHRITGRIKKELQLGTRGKIFILEQTKIFDSTGTLLFEERLKSYPLILCSRVVSVFGGAADRGQFLSKNPPRPKKPNFHKTNLTESTVTLNELYAQVRNFREERQINSARLEPILLSLDQNFPLDWLLRLELLEIFEMLSPNNLNTAHLREHLKHQSESRTEWKDLISRGLSLIYPPQN